MASKEEEEAIVERWKEYFNGPAAEPVPFPDDPYFAPMGMPAQGGVVSRAGPITHMSDGTPLYQVRVNDHLNELVPTYTVEDLDEMARLLGKQTWQLPPALLKLPPPPPLRPMSGPPPPPPLTMPNPAGRQWEGTKEFTNRPILCRLAIHNQADNSLTATCRHCGYQWENPWD